ncbi:ABC transporter ATP-binding protein [Haloimpatiens massiliensis]|uniref:ABC transporter ATP-binding protein n=1 Tax=Haloimpatiens massiliensis TaxID=1658110 RepID=UPI000C8311C6|nr:ABC transporter ATP-binding protein [Haloimpatiens massiliensis]
MSEKVQRDKPKYSTFTNTMYLIKNIWRWDKTLWWLVIVQIPITVIIPLIGIYLPKIVIDSVTSNLSVSKLMINLGIPVVIMIFLNIILNTTESITYFRKSPYRFRYIQLIMNKAMDTDYENTDSLRGQEKLSRTDKALMNNQAAAEAIVEVIIELFSNMIGFVIYAGIIVTIHPFIVIFIILSSVINYFIGRYVNKYEHKNKENIVPMERKIEYIRKRTGDFKSSKDIRLYNMFPWFKSMYKIFQKKEIYFKNKNIKRRYFANFIDGILLLLRDGITYGFLIYSVIYRGMAMGNFVMYFGAVAGFSTWLSGIVKNINTLNSFSLDICDLREYLEMEDKMNRGQGIEIPAYGMPCDIELKNVYYKYGGAEDYTIKNMNLHIKKGEKLALVGVNGAGKTTLVKLICGLYTPTKGQIYINGKKSSLYNRDDYYTLFSVVFQEMHALPTSIEKNIAPDIEKNIDEDKMQRVLNLSGLMKKIESLPKKEKTPMVKSVHKDAVELSGGEMQKLMLAKALYKDAPIIILDEPTAALDPIAENEIYQKYNELTKGHTSIFISHRLSSTRFCDRIVFIENGAVKEEGDHYSLMNKEGKYRKMYDMQSYYYKNNVGGEKYA